MSVVAQSEFLDTFLDYVGPLDRVEQQVSIVAYRELAKGSPVDLADLANAAKADEDDVRRILDSWSGVYTDTEGRLVGYWGLAIPEMDHVFRVEGQTLYTWCAWDALFIPELIRKTAHISSKCPTTGEKIELVVSPTSIESVSPEAPSVTFADAQDCGSDVIGRFCSFVFFFRDEDAANEWAGTRDNVIVVSLEDAYSLGREKNRMQYGDTLLTKEAL